MLVAAIICAVFLIVLSIRIGVSAEYSASGFLAALTVCNIRITLYPRNKAKKKKNVSKGTKTESKDQKEKKPLTGEGGRISEFLQLMPPVQRALGCLKKKLVIDRITIHYTSACDDPFDAVMAYGCANAGISAVYPVLYDMFKIKKSDFYTSVDFNLSQPVVYINLKLSLSVFAILYIAILFLIEYLRISGTKDSAAGTPVDRKHNRKADQNGK